MRADRGLIHAGHKGGTAWRTNRGRGIEAIQAHPFGGELIQVGRPDFFGTVGAKVLAKIFGDKPENVWPGRVILLGCKCRGSKEQKQPEALNFHKGTAGYRER